MWVEALLSLIKEGISKGTGLSAHANEQRSDRIANYRQSKLLGNNIPIVVLAVVLIIVFISSLKKK